ncbi:hypothetical protein FHG87_011875 [Trinorchestia longiramus]|nr:hypothetical protein FHG87_011875 [Trinorchestia longiramus]
MSGDHGQVLLQSSPGNQRMDSYAWNAASSISNGSTFVAIRRSTGEKKENEREKGNKRDVVKKRTEEEAIQLCTCGLGSRVVQLRHDLTHVHDVHEKLLRGLHEQIELLKTRNRDLTFQLLLRPDAPAAASALMPFSPESDEGERVSQRHSSSASEAVTPSSASNGDNSDLPTASTRSSALDKTTSRRGFEVASAARSQDLGNASTAGSPQNVVSVHGREGIATQNIRQIGDRKSDEEKANNNLESVSGSQRNRNSKERGKEKTGADSADSKYQSRKNQNSSEQLPFNPLTGLVGTTAVFTPPPINSSDPSAMILWRAQRGRAGHGDPRMVQSLDQELLEAADVTGRLRADQLRANQQQGLTQRLSRCCQML